MVAGFEAVVLENVNVRAVVIPSLGGRVWELTDRIRDRQWIWHREHVPLAAPTPGASYDDVWAGGWEELFPNDAPGWFEGRMLPDHGEWWTTPWSVTETSDGAESLLRLEAETVVRRTKSVKEFRLGASANTLEVVYRVENLEEEDFHYLFKQHLPVAVTPSCELALPGGLVTAVDHSFGTMLSGAGPYAWPLAKGLDGAPADLRRVRPQSEQAREFVYVSELPAGWCGVDDGERGAAMRMRFDVKQMPYVWLFLTYGGWRECYTAVLEPCTNMPKDLAAAARCGQSARLAAGGHFETRVSVTLCGIGED